MNKPLGNPCSPAVGAKRQVDVDYTGAGVFPLRFERTYNSLIWSLGKNRYWRHSYDRYIEYDTTGTIPVALVHRHDGTTFFFREQSGVYVTNSDVNYRLDKLLDPSGQLTGWELYVPDDDSIETFDTAGLLVQITNRYGLSQTLEYSDQSTPVAIAQVPGLLTRVQDPFGRALQFEYDSLDRLIKVIDPAGNEILYTYIVTTGVLAETVKHDKMISEVTYPGLSSTPAKKQYYYHVELLDGTNGPNGVYSRPLTHIADENGSLFTTYTYDSEGRTIATEKAGGVNRYEFVPVGGWASTVRNVTDPLGVVRTYRYQIIDGVYYLIAIEPGSGLPCPACGPKSAAYDTQGNPTQRVDWNDNVTTYTYDLATNLETSRTEASGTPQARTISTTWHPTYRLPTLITEPGKSTAMTYDANGNLLTRTITDTATSSSRTWTNTYTSIGQILTMDGPRTDVSDVTTYTYYADTDPDTGKAGNLASITNPLNQTTQITAYDANGRPLTIIDPNGLTTTLTYHPRGWLTSRTVGGELTTYTYDNVGQLTQVTLPDTSFLSYTYDAAHRMTEIADNLGNKIVYTLDTMGNRTNEQVLDPLGALAQTRSRVFNNLNRLIQDIGGTTPTTQITQYGYDNQGNLTTITDALNRVTTNAYDALNRLAQITDPATGVTQYGYNALDQLVAVTDPRSNATTYNLDALDNLNTQISPDTGTTTNTFDAAGNVLTSTDAKGQVTTYTYDALNRVSTITYHDTSSVTYGYDTGINGIGRLTSINENAPGGALTTQTLYTYDAQGRVLSDTRVIGTQSYVTQYAYDASGRMDSVTYPTGMALTYGFDGLGRVQRVTATRNGTAQILVDGVAYHPFGGVKNLVFGNGESYTRGFDLDGRISSYTLANLSHAVSYDDLSRITALPATANAAQTQTYGYDNLDRLTSAVNATTSHSYTYDLLGNRQSHTVGAATTTYQYPANSNRLTSVTAPAGAVSTVVHDANGAIIDDGADSFTYDTRGRLIGAQSALGPVVYQVNNLGQRYIKTVQGVTTVYHYDSAGHLIAETDVTGTTQVEYVWMGDQPVAMLR